MKPVSRSFAITLALWGGFFTYLWLKIVHDAPDGLRVGAAYMWGDWGLHYLISSVAAYRPLDCWFTNHPVFLGQRFDYPFVVDFISGILRRTGADLGASFLWPSIFLTLLLIGAIYQFCFSLTKSGLKSFLILSLLFLNGGLGFVEFFMEWSKTDGFWSFFPQHLYSHWSLRGYHYGNMTITEFLPQRAFLLGMPIALVICAYLLRAMEETVDRGTVKDFGFGILAGSLLFIHPHSYLLIVLFSGFIVLRQVKLWRMWTTYAFGAFLPSIIWWYGMHNHSSGGSGFFNWYPGWMAYEAENGRLGFLIFWALNWGLLLPLAIIGTIRHKLDRNPIVMFGFVMFALCNLIKFQPWSWDNTKLFTYSYLFLSIPVVYLICELLEHPRKIGQAIGTLLFLSLTLTGAIDLIGIIKQSSPGYMMYTKDEISLAEVVKTNTNACDIVLTSTDHHHWLPALTGRQILMGYAGWVGSYGLDYGTRERDIRAMYSGGAAALAMMKQYNVNYALIGPKEISDFAPNRAYFDANFPIVLDQNGTRLYRIK